MALDRRRPLDLVERVASRRERRIDSPRNAQDVWRRETFSLPRAEALVRAEEELKRAQAREWFDRYPKAAYLTEIEFWRELSDGRIEFIMRRLPTAD